MTALLRIFLMLCRWPNDMEICSRIQSCFFGDEGLSSTLFHVKISPPLLDGVGMKDGDGMGLKDRIVEYDDDDDQGDLSNDVEEMTPQIFKRPSSNCVLKKPAANKGKTECIDGKKSEGIKSKTDIECILVKSLKKIIVKS